MQAAEPVIRQHDDNRVFRLHLLEKHSDHFIKTAVTISSCLYFVASISRITAGLLDERPKLMLRPVRLLKMHHEDVPVFVLEEVQSYCRLLLEAQLQLMGKLSKLRLGPKRYKLADPQVRLVIRKPGEDLLTYFCRIREHR